ncbi:MAG TPA: M14 family metallopeptidase [Planctomycetota bacterium]|nr:M14 family metallopeptidase [Planctomycetota bacterium]
MSRTLRLAGRRAGLSAGRLAGPLSGVVLAAALPLSAQVAPEPRTVPEATGYAETSRAADVARFCEALHGLPHGDRLTTRVAGRTHGDREQLLVHVALPDPAPGGRLRALVIGNIHAGEVEGKEALQVLLREFAAGEHEDLLQKIELWFLPIYNVDGNEAMGIRNRPGQNGPAAAGQRANAQGLDLNRDFVKLDAPETRTLLGLFTTIDPHMFVDLHTTNGSYHGYHLTYAPSLSPNVDRDVAHLTRAVLDDATATMRSAHGFAAFDYGNFETHDWDGSGAPESTTGVRGWYSYDSRARYGVNYFGLRNRLGVLSEAYSYADFETRIAATRAFVLSLLQSLAARADEVRRVCALADRRLVPEDASGWFGFETTFGAPEQLPVLVGAVDRVEGKDGAPPRFVRKGDGTPETMPVLRSFVARRQRALPQAWAIAEPPPDVVDRLQRHGIVFSRLDAPRPVHAERFAVSAKKKPKRPYQGHQELVLAGEWQPAAPTTLPAGALVVSAHQPLVRVAATLLEAESEDSLSTWNFFEASTDDYYPVLRIVGRD